MQKPSRYQVITAVGKVTCQEILSDRILYNGFVFAGLLFVISVLASRLNVFRPDRVMLDFGLMAVSWSCNILAILLGASVLIREFEKRTIDVAWSHPISRFDFLVGKFCGILGVLTLNWCLLVSVYLGMMSWMSYEGIAMISFALMEGLVFVLLQSWILCSIAIFFSVFSTTSLSIMLTIGYYLLGVNHSQLRWVVLEIKTGWVHGLLKSLIWCLPNFEYFHLGTQVSYGLSTTLGVFFSISTYAVLMVLFFLSLAGFFIRMREF